MTSPYSSLNKDVYGHFSLLILLTAAITLLSGIIRFSLVLGASAGIFLTALYYLRVRKLQVQTRTPISDVFIALGGIISTIYLINELTFVSIPDLFSSFSPFMAIGVLVIGILSKLLLVEELLKSTVSAVNNSFNKIIKWTLRSQKNKLRVFLAVLGLILFIIRPYFDDTRNKEISTSVGLVLFSVIVLLDVNQVPQLSNRRRIISIIGSLILLSRIFTFSSDFNYVGSTVLGLSLLISSINRYHVYSWFVSLIMFFKIILIKFYLGLKSTIKDFFTFAKLHILIILRILSFIIGLVLILIPSSNSFNLIGSLLIIISILPTAIKWIKLFGRRILVSAKNFIVFIYESIYLISLAIFQWIARNNLRILKFISTLFSIGIIILGPQEYFLNYISGLTILGITHRTYFQWFLISIYHHLRKIVNYFGEDFSRTSGYMGIFGLLGFFTIKDDYTEFSLIILFSSAILLGLGWDYMIFRFLDTITNFIILFVEGLTRIFANIGLFIYRGITIRKFVSIISWILLIIALFNIFSVNRWILVISWIVLWHVAYPHRIDRLKAQLTQLIHGIVTFVRNLIRSLINGIRRLFYALKTLLVSLVVTLYTHTIVMLLWAIGLFLLVMGLGLILPFSLSYTEEIFGSVAKDTLISFIIGIVLLSAAILSIQQTYLRREKLLIGGSAN